MGIKEYIQNEILSPRLQEAESLVVYDPDRRYQALCMELATENLQVVDASESSIESREAAMAALQSLGQGQLEGLLVYVPARAPLNDEERTRDPFSIYSACGAIFPQGDGDEYRNLCLKAKAAHLTEIRRIFDENPDPSFAVIDAVGSGTGWPTLQALLEVESAHNIILALLVPSATQQKALKGQDAWVSEAATLFESVLGLKLLTQARSWRAISDELWRFLLFSEFALDLPVPLPDALADVPKSKSEAQVLVESLCDCLRNDQRTQAIYIQRAEVVERELSLSESCRDIQELGERDTFPFEERFCFVQAIEALNRGNDDGLRQLLEQHHQSVWVGRGENQVQWLLLQSAARLIQACDDAERQLPDHSRSQQALIDYYIASLREVDRLQREFELAAGDYIDIDGQMTVVMEKARTTYQQLINSVQCLFVKHLKESGWPPLGRLSNADVFDKIVAFPLQESGCRIALFLIDALRYELGVELHKELAEDGQVTLQPAFAQLPSITLVGMASLLPGAGQHLQVVRQGRRIAAVLGDQLLPNVSQRMDVLRQRYGHRFAETSLMDFARGNFEIPDTVELLVLRSNEMDNDFESNPEAAPGLITRTFQQIQAAIYRLRNLGFEQAFIATDHGFYLNPRLEAGNVCAKPPGSWINIHDRMLLGDGSEDSFNYVLSAQDLGVRGDFDQVAGPRAMVAYRAGVSYFHGGVSLQEAIVPVIDIRLYSVEEALGKQPTVSLQYKRGNRITTRLPVFEVTAGLGDLFSREVSSDILVVAYNEQGQVVGEAKPGGEVNPATLALSLKPGETVKVTVKMDLEYEGRFTVKALDPTTLTVFDKLDLETNYMV